MPEPPPAKPGVFERQNGVIILLDSLGTRGILASRTPQVVVNDWREIVQLFEQTTAAAATAAGPACTNWRVLTFSDTIMITLAGSTTDGLLAGDLILSAGATIFVPFYAALLRGVFLRGALAAGVFYQDGSKVIGPAIDEAAAWYETTDWIGVSATPSFGHYLELLERRGTDVSDSFVRYQIPFRQTPYRGWAFAWPKRAATRGSDVKTVALEAFVRHAGSLGAEVAPKYRNTLAFIDHCFAAP